MEGFLEGLGTVALVILVIVGALAGWIASKVAGGRTALYVIVGIVAAVATPFVLAAVGLGALAAGGLLVVLVMGLIGAVIVLILVRALFGGKD